MVDFAKLGKAAAEQGADMTKTVSGGGEAPTPAAEGPCRLRFVGYIEVGTHPGRGMAKGKKVPECILQFEISGPKHPPRDFDGEKVPHRVELTLTNSRHEKATLVKVFNILNYEGKAQSFFELLGKGYLATIRHRKYKRTDGTEGVAIELTDAATKAYTIRPPRFDDPETGEPRVIEVAPVIGPLRGFLWEHGDKDQWDTLFIDGEYEAQPAKDGKPAKPAKSKNFYQNKIKSALNFKGSVAHQILGGGDVDISAAMAGDDDEGHDVTEDIPATSTAAAVPTGTAADDALSGVV